MSDFADLTARVLAFREAREWSRFHTPRNLAASISIEAGELLEIFQWDLPADTEIDSARREHLAEELADISIYALLLASETGIDLGRAIEDKLVKNEEKYPVEKAKGRSTKYTDL